MSDESKRFAAVESNPIPTRMEQSYGQLRHQNGWRMLEIEIVRDGLDVATGKYLVS